MSGMFSELQYFALGAQTNVYGITQITLQNDATILLVATLKGKVFSIDIKNVKPVSKEIQFTYIPTGMSSCVMYILQTKVLSRVAR